MSNKRRKFSTEFKSKVVLEALKERETVEILAKKYELHPTQVSTWKRQALLNFSKVFSKELAGEVDKGVDPQVLYAQIGELKVANDFLKKKLQ